MLTKMSTVMKELKTKHFWRMSRAWRGQSEEYFPINFTVGSLQLIISTTEESPLRSRCNSMMAEVVWQANATEQELEQLP